MAKGTTIPPLLIRPQFEIILNTLTELERGKMLTAIMAYQWRSETPSNFTERMTTIFELLTAFIDDDNNKYAEKCETNRRNIQSRYENKPSDENLPY